MKLTEDQKWRVQDLVSAWRFTQSEILTGRLDSVTGARARIQIMREARAEGLEEPVRKVLFRGAKI